MSLLKWFREWRQRPNNVITRNAKSLARLADKIEAAKSQMELDNHRLRSIGVETSDESESE